MSWNGKNGTVSFVGRTSFASGEWIGVTLDVAEGMHDGSVMGKSYFECSPKCGIFAQAAQLTTQGAAPAPPAAATVAAASPQQTTTAAAPAAVPSSLEIGAKVCFQGNNGTVSYIGSARFAPGEWVGVTLDTPVGMHNGTVMGVPYFECPEKCGIFTQASQLTSSGAAPPSTAPPASAPPAAVAAAPVPAPEVGAKVTWNGKAGTVKYVGSARFAPGEWVGVELDAAEGMHNGSVMGVTYFECAAKKGIFAPAAQLQVLSHAGA